MKNILILAENLEVNRTSSGLRSNKQILSYSKNYKVSVLTSTPLNLFKQINNVDYNFLNTEREYKTFVEKIPKLSAIPAYLDGLNVASKITVSKWVGEINRLLKNTHFDLILSLGSGLSFMPSYAMQRINKNLYGKYLMFIHDPFPSHYYPKPYQKPSSFLYNTQAKRFQKAINKANIISFPSLRLKEWMCQYYDFSEDKCIIQPHLGLSIKELKDILTEDEDQRLPVYPKGLNIVHTGTLLGPRSPEYLIQALEKLFKTFTDAKSVVNIHVIGKLTRDWDSEKLSADNVHVYPERFSYFNSLKLQKASDVLLLLEANSEFSPFMPGKLADYLIADKPILALTPKQSETTRILGENYPLLVENGDVGEIYKKLVIIYKSYQEGSINELIPNKKAKRYVRPEEWINNLKKTLT